ncbi:MAG: hypothetical protein HC904_02115 [Blastochloris sp.]|nr:hypothetical protein [Blastochloris sp.]
MLRLAGELLKPGGVLVMVNPFRMEARQGKLQRDYAQTVDLGGFDCHLERYRRK